MELLRAQREGREEEFKKQEREKLMAKKAAELDKEMDDYFKEKDAKKDDEKDEVQKEKDEATKPSDDQVAKEDAAKSDLNEAPATKA